MSQNTEQMNDINSQFLTLMMQKFLQQSNDQFNRISKKFDYLQDIVNKLLAKSNRSHEAYSILLDYIKSKNLLNDVLQFIENSQNQEGYDEESVDLVKREIHFLNQ